MRITLAKKDLTEQQNGPNDKTFNIKGTVQFFKKIYDLYEY